MKAGEGHAHPHRVTQTRISRMNRASCVWTGVESTSSKAESKSLGCPQPCSLQAQLSSQYRLCPHEATPRPTVVRDPPMPSGSSRPRPCVLCCGHTRAARAQGRCSAGPPRMRQSWAGAHPAGRSPVVLSGRKPRGNGRTSSRFILSSAHEGLFPLKRFPLGWGQNGSFCFPLRHNKGQYVTSYEKHRVKTVLGLFETNRGLLCSAQADGEDTNRTFSTGFSL